MNVMPKKCQGHTILDQSKKDLSKIHKELVDWHDVSKWIKGPSREAGVEKYQNRKMINNQIKNLTQKLPQYDSICELINGQIRTITKILLFLDPLVQMLGSEREASFEDTAKIYLELENVFDGIIPLINIKNPELKNINLGAYMFAGASKNQPYTIIKSVEKCERLPKGQVVDFIYNGSSHTTLFPIRDKFEKSYELVGTADGSNMSRGVFQDAQKNIDLFKHLIQLREIVLLPDKMGKDEISYIKNSLCKDYEYLEIVKKQCGFNLGDWEGAKMTCQIQLNGAERNLTNARQSDKCRLEREIIDLEYKIKEWTARVNKSDRLLRAINLIDQQSSKTDEQLLSDAFASL